MQRASVGVQRFRRLPVRCQLDQVARGAIAKIVSNAVCYPIESYKIIKQKNKGARVKRFQDLYSGFRCFCIYNAFHSCIYYGLFYCMMDTVTGHLPSVSYAARLKLAAVLSAFATGLYKVPFSYFLRNAALLRHVNFRDAFGDRVLFFKRYAISVVDDASDTFFKFYLRHVFDPVMGCFAGTLLTGVTTALLLTPVDVLKTRLLTTPESRLRVSFEGWQLRIASSALNIILFSSMAHGG